MDKVHPFYVETKKIRPPYQKALSFVFICCRVMKLYTCYSSLINVF